MERVWQFGLYPVDDQRTRFVSRGMERFQPTLRWWLAMRIMEPAAFIMTRRFTPDGVARSRRGRGVRDCADVRGPRNAPEDDDDFLNAGFYARVCGVVPWANTRAWCKSHVMAQVVISCFPGAWNG